VNALPPTIKIFLSYCLSFSTRAMKVAIAADDHERVYVVSRERHFQSVQREVISAPFLSPPGSCCAEPSGQRVPSSRGCSFPPASSSRRRSWSRPRPVLDRFKNRPDVKVSVQRLLDAYFDVVEIDEHSDLQLFFLNLCLVS